MSRLCLRAISMQSVRDMLRGSSALVWASAERLKQPKHNQIRKSLIGAKDWGISVRSSNQRGSEKSRIATPETLKKKAIFVRCKRPDVRLKDICHWSFDICD